VGLCCFSSTRARAQCGYCADAGARHPQRSRVHTCTPTHTCTPGHTRAHPHSHNHSYTTCHHCRTNTRTPTHSQAITAASTIHLHREARGAAAWRHFHVGAMRSTPPSYVASSVLQVVPQDFDNKDDYDTAVALRRALLQTVLDRQADQALGLQGGGSVRPSRGAY
jgi:hypothetical protein